MKKNTKILAIVIVAAVLLTGLMLLLIFMPNGSEDGTATVDEGISMITTTDEDGVHQAQINTNEKGEIDNNSYGTLIEYVPADIATIHIENTKGTLDVISETPVNEDGTTEATVYKIKGYEDKELQSGVPDSIANDAAQIEFTEVVTLEKDKASEYGFDKPRSTVTVTYTDDTKAVIYIGDNAPQSAGTYVKFGDGDAIYFVTTDAVDSFDYGLTDLMSLTINSSADSGNSQASSITISGSNFPNEIQLVPNDGVKSSASYVMKKPVERYANEVESSNVEGAIRGLYAESVKMVNPSSSQLSELGLSNPYAEIKAVYPDVTVDIIASKPDGEGKVCLMEKGGDVVYVMASANLPWVTTSYESLVNEYVLYPKMTALSSVSINDGSKTYDFKLSTKETTTTDDGGEESTSTTTTVQYGKDEIDISYFSTLFQNIALTELADCDEESASGSPVLSVTYTYSTDGSSDKVEFYETGNNRYVAKVNGKSVGHAHKSGINKIIKQVSTVASNKQIDSIL
ncbi:MAG: DUF4340 domain-containing protein [Ruminococcus sp.]|nr:DUF4340 domain-containing protein [Ruminococcus sp.]